FPRTANGLQHFPRRSWRHGKYGIGGRKSHLYVLVFEKLDKNRPLVTWARFEFVFDSVHLPEQSRVPGVVVPGYCFVLPESDQLKSFNELLGTQGAEIFLLHGFNTPCAIKASIPTFLRTSQLF